MSELKPKSLDEPEELVVEDGLPLVLYPNPTVEMFSVDRLTSQPTGDNYRLVISDALGRPVLERMDYVPGESVTVRTLAPGSYVVGLWSVKEGEAAGAGQLVIQL